MSRYFASPFTSSRAAAFSIRRARPSPTRCNARLRGVRDVHVGRHIVVELDAEDASAAERRDDATMCEKLLANPVTEDFEIAGVEASA